MRTIAISRWPVVVTLVLLAMLRAEFCKSQTSGNVSQRAGTAVVVMDVASGSILERTGAVDAGALPGSALKPLLLMAALQAHVIGEHETFACRGTLTVAGHNLACSHPRDVTVLDARQALANSCNAYFASLARRMPAAVMASSLRDFGVLLTQVPRDADDRVLTALGLQGVSISPIQMALAYRKLAAEMNTEAAGTRVVRDGMVQSVETGMAHAAHVEGVTLGGKTGTVDAGGGRSHGWFAGIIFDAQGKAQRAVVVFVPNGNGNDAALAAQRVVKAMRGAK